MWLKMGISSKVHFSANISSIIIKDTQNISWKQGQEIQNVENIVFVTGVIAKKSRENFEVYLVRQERFARLLCYER